MDQASRKMIGAASPGSAFVLIYSAVSVTIGGNNSVSGGLQDLKTGYSWQGRQFLPPLSLFFLHHLTRRYVPVLSIELCLYLCQPVKEKANESTDP
jgi:hypothetical protein